MFHQPFQPLPQRALKTSEPRFKRLDRIVSPQSRVSTQQNFNPGGKTSTLDNSKQNLLYENHLIKVRSACKLDEATIVSKYLSSIRKDYDDMNKLSRKHLTSMKLKKREIEFMKHKNQIFCEKRKQLQTQIDTQQKSTEEVKLKEQDAKMQTKILQNIIVRMKKDQIYYKLQGRIRDQQLKKKIKQVKFFDQTLIQEEEKLQKLLSNLQSCKNLYEKNKEIRQKKFQDFSGKISDVKERERFIHERKERTYQLQSIELNDTLDQKNIHMREIILVHKVADSLLEGKVNSLIQKYSDIQEAFHLVKIKTGVSQPHHLTNKFFSYEQTSESLLETISDNEKQLEELRKKKNELTHKYKSLTNQHLMSDQLNPMKNDCQETWKEKIVNEINRNNLLVDSIMNWIYRMFLDVRQTELSKKVTLQDSFSLLCDSLQTNLGKYKNFDWKEHKLSTMGVCLKKVFQEKSPEQLSLRMRETQDLNESNLIEEEYIKSSRKTIQKKAFTIKQIKRDYHD